MINKKHFVQILEKINLDNNVEQCILSIQNNKLHARFSNSTSSFIGEINSVLELTDVKIPIYELSSLLKLLKILDNENINIDFESMGGILEKMLIHDVNYKLTFRLCDPFLIPEAKKTRHIEYNETFNLSPDIIDKFIKSKKSLDKEIDKFVISSDGVDTKIILGGNNDFYNKIEFILGPSSSKGEAVFNSDLFKSILENNSVFTEAQLSINYQGIICLKFLGDYNIESTYYVVADKN